MSLVKSPFQISWSFIEYMLSRVSASCIPCVYYYIVILFQDDARSMTCIYNSILDDDGIYLFKYFEGFAIIKAIIITCICSRLICLNVLEFSNNEFAF